MSVEEKFDGVKNTFSLFMAFFNEVAQEIGMEKAVALDAKVGRATNADIGKMMREQAGAQEIDAKTAYMMTSKAVEEGFAISSEVIEESPQKVVFNIGKCPIHEACQMAGMDSESIEALCRATSIESMDAMVKELNPNLSYRLAKFRSAEDGCCKEEIVIAE